MLFIYATTEPEAYGVDSNAPCVCEMANIDCLVGEKSVNILSVNTRMVKFPIEYI